MAATVKWAADGEKAGPSNNPFLEWAAYLGPHPQTGNKHECVNLVKETSDATKAKPLRGSGYMYEHEQRWCGVGSGEQSIYGGLEEDRLEVSNQLQSPAQTSVPAGLEASGAYHWTEGSEGWIAHAVYFPKLPAFEAHWSEDPYGCLPISQLHGQGGAVPFAFSKVRKTQKSLRWNGEAYKPTIYVETKAGDWADPEELKIKTWYRYIWYYKVSTNATIGEVKCWIAKGAEAPFTQIINGKGVTLNASFMYPCLGGPRSEATPKGEHCNTGAEHEKLGAGETKASCEAQTVPTETFYHSGMTFIGGGTEKENKALAESVLKAGTDTAPSVTKPNTQVSEINKAITPWFISAINTTKYKLSSQPTGIEINASTGEVKGTPTVLDESGKAVTVTAEGTGTPATAQFQWKVVNVLPKTFGNTNENTAQAGFLNAARKRVNKYTAPACSVSKLSLYVYGGGSEGTQKVRGIIYSDSSGAPSSLLGVSNELVLASPVTSGWKQLDFPSAITVPAGPVWIGIITGGSTGVIGYLAATVSEARYANADEGEPTGTPSSTFGTPEIENENMALYATYTESGGPPVPKVGSVLKTSNGKWENEPTEYKYQWQRGTTNITSNAKSQSYTAVTADKGSTLRVVVTAKNAAGSAAAASAPTPAVQ